MKRVLPCVLFGALLGSAQAADAPPAVTPMGITAPALEVKPEHRGYAADKPEIFIRQRLFGRIHGLSMLTAACLDLPAYSKDIRRVYAAWYEIQAETIKTIVRDLGSYYFGSRAGEATWFDLVHALNLPDRIEPAMGEVTLHSACASLPEAIPRSRYALDKLLAGIGDADALPDDIAVATSKKIRDPGAQSAPAPTIQKPAE